MHHAFLAPCHGIPPLSSYVIARSGEGYHTCTLNPPLQLHKLYYLCPVWRMTMPCCLFHYCLFATRGKITCFSLFASIHSQSYTHPMWSLLLWNSCAFTVGSCNHFSSYTSHGYPGGTTHLARNQYIAKTNTLAKCCYECHCLSFYLSKLHICCHLLHNSHIHHYPQAQI